MCREREQYLVLLEMVGILIDPVCDIVKTFFLGKLELEFPFDPEVPFIGIYSRSQKHNKEKTSVLLFPLKHYLLLSKNRK